MNKKRTTRVAGVGIALLAIVAVVACSRVCFFSKPPTAHAADLSATSTVVFGLNVYGYQLLATATPNQSINTGPMVDAQGVAINPGDYKSGVPDKIYINASSFSVDFRVGMMICDDSGENCHTGWTPWASDVADGNATNDYSPIVGGGPLDGGTFCGANTATLHNRLGDIFIGAQTRPLPAGAVLDSVSLTLFPLEYDFNVPVDDVTAVNPACWNPYDDAVGTPGFTSGGWSNDAFDKWNNASTDGFVIEMIAGATSYNASYVSANIPGSFSVGETTTTGTDGKPLEITMKNTGAAVWPSEQGNVVGTPTGSCTVDTNGDGIPDAPAANTSGSCTVDYNYNGIADELNHTAGSFTPAPNPMQYTRVVPITTIWAPATTVTVPLPRSAPAQMPGLRAERFPRSSLLLSRSR